MRATRCSEFHAAGDKRAIFLRLYYIMTLEVHAAIHGLGDYQGQAGLPGRRLGSGAVGEVRHPLLQGPRHPRPRARRGRRASVEGGRHGLAVRSGRRSCRTRCSASTPTSTTTSRGPSRRTSTRPSSTTTRRCSCASSTTTRSTTCSSGRCGPIQDVLARDYAPGIALIDNLLGKLDERLSEAGLKYYRERVWWDALTYASALKNGTEAIVRDKLNWESHKVAEFLRTKRELWIPERVLGLPVRAAGHPALGSDHPRARRGLSRSRRARWSTRWPDRRCSSLSGCL